MIVWTRENSSHVNMHSYHVRKAENTVLPSIQSFYECSIQKCASLDPIQPPFSSGCMWFASLSQARTGPG